MKEKLGNDCKRKKRGDMIGIYRQVVLHVKNRDTGSRRKVCEAREAREVVVVVLADGRMNGWGA